ncbi:peptide chain release factor 1 [Candidatus Azambacteria bacterium RIFCSPLOWO2_02_FULL_46_11]|uniref:Peptide chain release factor 1 n=2 Tax=Candidatus Azamiibacteriota TaxID=1752741 RepID=A0A1F5C5P9_9BACT|nr:MAG: peptide chain release factor 1 [Candidatus Azambacteria bacterium RIFCSPLOWO2_01_FULL_46_26]OGD43328.1 MAG: peptide chain release factor 1 [Candidatus Azambacteria bacterium RIFCSPLOWO2_02_FULL_46_11]
MSDKIELLKKEREDLTKKLADPGVFSDVKKSQELSKRFAEVEKILIKREELEKIENETKETEQILKTETDLDLINLAEDDLKKLAAKKEHLKSEIDGLMSGQKPVSEKDVIMEIRAGTGGNEAAMFAADLFRMYKRYAEKNGWYVDVLDSSETELGGCKEIIFEINGPGVFSKLIHESGVHRVQRIPVTEKSGRIHTSTATVAVLPKAEDVEIKIEAKDLKIDTYRSSGPGGQNVNKVETAIRITHLPTGTVVACQTDRSQAKNKEKAMRTLKSKILEMQRAAEAAKITGERRAQIGGAERAEKIRTYNFPQDRLTDHRIKKSWHNLPGILEGDLGQIIEEMSKSPELSGSQTL